MSFRLGAVPLAKGGKILSSAYNHQRPHYEGTEPGRRHGCPVVRVHVSLHLQAPCLTCAHCLSQSMHAEQHATFALMGVSPSMKAQGASVAGVKQQVQLGAQAAGIAKQKEDVQGALSSGRAPSAAPRPSVAGVVSVRVSSTEEEGEHCTRTRTRTCTSLGFGNSSMSFVLGYAQ
jgi:hypothetical protein